jgi:hypothetical protein
MLDSTLTIFEDMFTARPGRFRRATRPFADRMPAQIRRGFFYGGLEVPSGMDQRYRDSFAQMLKMLKAFYDAGIPLVAGTDGLAGFTLATRARTLRAGWYPRTSRCCNWRLWAQRAS